ncbi:sensor histidine kinase [Sedimenticola hydrogenitrophicus]|uniref:sensor histidine kinase n=1 Tax=Sedimenticola hydrogenitrophicus TaxID=2967975 RepID=UPI0021A2BE94|nr:HAMP domain-containing sensor histidine kinase [Sedimenticola hydrogenitrophicus]
MRSPFDLSFRLKIPLWGSLLIVVTTLAISTSMMVQAYNDVRSDLVSSASSLGGTLAQTLFPAMLHDDVWQATEIIRASLHGGRESNVLRPELVFVLDREQKVFISSQPQTLPLLADIRQRGEEYRRLVDWIATDAGLETRSLELAKFHRIYVATPIVDTGAYLGTLVTVHSKEALLARFYSVAWRGLGIGLVVLAILLPINWFWGRRTAVPMVQLTNSIVDMAQGRASHLLPQNYTHRDELGRLFEAYELMVEFLQDRARLEQGMIRAERLAAIGRLSAGIAHEINNPLGGMLVALNNFRRRNGQDERALATVSMIERGLHQIHEIVNAMLVEAKGKARDFAPQDVEDIHQLLAAETRKCQVTLQIDSNIERPVPLRATLVRQILMNLTLNAIQASDRSGEVRCTIHIAGDQLLLHTENGGKTIPPEVVDHLFEPFVGNRESGHGLGLWIVYQIVTQQKGQISAESRGGVTQFTVNLPLGDPA